MRAGLGLAALVVGLVSGAAGTLVHQRWWGLALALGAALATLAWLPAGGVRLAFAAGWCVPVLRGALERPGGGFLISGDAIGWSFLAGSAVLLVAAVTTAGAGRRTPGPDARGHADDPGVRGLPS
ncbi:hypothetical protein [uncultured Nocardioides sp.]|uniref:hypothetical protein n=1 Tax=uncultured Nocardioides sp. TaxID=198441 RepID=UPI0026089BBE|nr:hypothetical protein [uncultured Nocardioides sp.]